MKKFFLKNRKLFFLLAIIFGIIFFALIFKELQYYRQVTVGSTQIKVRLALTPNQQVNGLSRQKNFGNVQGVLFVYSQPARPTFWMKEMNFPIDLIWIGNKRVIGLEKNLLPEGKNPQNLYSSPGEIDYVLEVPAGFIEKNNIKIGDGFIW